MRFFFLIEIVRTSGVRVPRRPTKTQKATIIITINRPECMDIGNYFRFYAVRYRIDARTRYAPQCTTDADADGVVIFDRPLQIARN